jgi:hypothetical protein
VSFLHEKMDLFYPKQIGSMAFQVNPQVAPATAHDGVDTCKKDLTEACSVKQEMACCAGWECICNCIVCGRNPPEKQSVYCGLCIAELSELANLPPIEENAMDESEK